MILKHVILHILDKDAGNLIASQAEIDLTQPGLHDYLEKIIMKFQTGDFKPGTLTGEDYLAQTIDDNNGLSFAEKPPNSPKSCLIRLQQAKRCRLAIY